MDKVDPILKSTQALLEVAARELERAYGALTVARLLVFEAAEHEWPYDGEVEIVPEGSEWKEHGIGALTDLGHALDSVLDVIRQGDLADATAFFEHRKKLESSEDEDLPF